MENTISVPTGTQKEDIERRASIIYSFYEAWKKENPSQKVYNISLKDDIHIRHISIDETARHASKRYLSTLAVLQLDAVLSGAHKVSYQKCEARKNQQMFKAMMIMEYQCPGLGTVKLTVGIRHRTLLKVQYCITAVEV